MKRLYPQQMHLRWLSTDNDDLSLTERISFLFGASNGYCRFVRMCEKKGFDLKDIKW